MQTWSCNKYILLQDMNDVTIVLCLNKTLSAWSIGAIVIGLGFLNYCFCYDSVICRYQKAPPEVKLHVSYNRVYKGSFPRPYLWFFRASVWQNHVFSFSSSFQVEIKEEVVFLVLVHKKLEKKKRNINSRWISVLNSRRERGVLVLELC